MSRNKGAATRGTARAAYALAVSLGVSLFVGPATAEVSTGKAQGGTARVLYRGSDIDSLDPALAYSVAAGYLIDPTCARLMRYDDGQLRPEVAVHAPRISRDGKTYTFTLRRGFRFSDGSPVRASAFAREIDRTLAPHMRSPWSAYTRDIVGAKDVLAGKKSTARGVTADGPALVVRLTHPVPDFNARLAGFLCAVPANLPADPEGVAAFPAAGPYYVAEYRPGQRVILRRNRFYVGKRTHHVDGFDVDLHASSQEEVVDRIETGKADWGWALPQVYFDPARKLAAKYGVNRKQFFVQPGSTFRGYAFNTARPLFRDNLALRRAVSFAVDRAAFRRASGGPYSTTLTDQYLPPTMPGYRDADIYPLSRPDLRRARALARGHTRSGKAVLYAPDLLNHLAFAQSIKKNLRQIGLEVSIKGIPLQAYFGKYMARGDYDLGFVTWTPDYRDPSAVLNVQLDSRFIGATNWSRFHSPAYDRRLRAAARLRGAPRYRAYGRLDVRLAGEEAPMLAVDFFNDAALVSKRVGCVNRPFELAVICLR